MVRRFEDLDGEPGGTGLEDALPGAFGGPELAADWSVPWSDLMMVMFILFAVLFIYNAAERDAGEAFAAPPSDGPPAETLYDQTRRAVQLSELEGVDVALQRDRSLRLSVSGPMLFELGSAELRPATREFLGRLALVLAQNDRRVRVAGHTDSFPVSSERFPTNWELSAIRATTVARYLIERGRLDPRRFEINAYSMYRPALPNDSAENKSRNRRVEIIVLPEES